MICGALAQSARDAIASSEKLVGDLASARKDLSAARKEAAHRANVDAAAKTMKRLDFDHRKMVAMMIDKGPCELPESYEYDLIHDIGYAVVEIEEIGDNKIRVTANQAAIDANKENGASSPTLENIWTRAIAHRGRCRTERNEYERSKNRGFRMRMRAGADVGRLLGR